MYTMKYNEEVTFNNFLFLGLMFSNTVLYRILKSVLTSYEQTHNIITMACVLSYKINVYIYCVSV